METRSFLMVCCKLVTLVPLCFRITSSAHTTSRNPKKLLPGWPTGLSTGCYARGGYKQLKCINSPSARERRASACKINVVIESSLFFSAAAVNQY